MNLLECALLNEKLLVKGRDELRDGEVFSGVSHPGER